MNAGLIFDMDGLLVDSEILWQKVETEILASYGATFSMEVAKRHLGMRIDEAVEIMLHEYGIDAEPGTFTEEILDALLVEFDRSLQPMPGAEAALAQAASMGGPVAIASSSVHRVVQHVVKHFGWDEVVRVICTGDEVARGKPAPDIFFLAAERMGLDPARCLVLEDSLNGARAAKAAGMRCLAVPNHAYEPDVFNGLADYVLPTLEGVSLADYLPRARTNGSRP